MTAVRPSSSSVVSSNSSGVGAPASVPASAHAPMPARAPAKFSASTSQQIWTWFQHHNRTIWRTPIATFFTIALPLVMMVVLSSFIDGSVQYRSDGSSVTFQDYYVPAMAAFAAASATYTNLCVSAALQREQGILKRVRGTPLATWKFFVSSIMSAIWLAFIGAVLLFVVGIALFDVSLDFSQLGWLAVFFAVGVSAFAVLGMAVSNLASTGQAGSAIANATILPLSFISGLFIPAGEIPVAIEIIGDIFPLKAFGEGMRGAFDPGLSSGNLWNLLLLVIWGLAGLFFMLRYFQWVPKAERE